MALAALFEVTSANESSIKGAACSGIVSANPKKKNPWFRMG